MAVILVELSRLIFYADCWIWAFVSAPRRKLQISFALNIVWMCVNIAWWKTTRRYSTYGTIEVCRRSRRNSVCYIIYVKLTIYTVNRRIYRNTSTNPNPAGSQTSTAILQVWQLYYSNSVWNHFRNADGSAVWLFCTRFWMSMWRFRWPNWT